MEKKVQFLINENENKLKHSKLKESEYNNDNSKLLKKKNYL